MVLVPALHKFTDVEEENLFPTSVAVVFPLLPGVPDGLWPAWGPALANGVALFGGKRLGRGGRRDVWPPGSHGPVTPDFGNTHFVGRDSVISLESVPVCILVGIVLGFLSGLGVGGGSLLILWLTAVLSMEQRTAQGVNLLFFLPAAIAACLFHSRQGRLQWRWRCQP